MGRVSINARCQQILNILLAGTDYLPLQRIADMMKVSRRSIYYDLCKINEWLSFYDIPEIEVERGKGLYLSMEDKKQIEDTLKNEGDKESYIFSPMERVKIIICYIIRCGEPVYIEQLSEFCQVSRNTIFNDLRVVVSQLQEYNLSLIYETKQGYRIEGDIIRIRALFFLYFDTLMPLFESGLLNFVDYDEIRRYYERLKQMEKKLSTAYVDGILLSLSALMPLMYKSKEQPYFQNLRMEEIERTSECNLVREYFPDLTAAEQTYLCLHLLGSRIAVAGDEIFDNPANQSVYEITKALIAEFEKIACVIFEEREALERSLFTHISASLYRYQYGIQIGNPMIDDVIREYPNLVDITRLASKYLAQLVGLPIPESEVAYLALHFGAHLKISRSANERLRILIVCVNGVSTGNMLKREIQKLLPHGKVVNVVAAVDIINIQNICDLVISTIKITSLVPTIVVHPILTDVDRKNILNHRLVTQNYYKDKGSQFFEIIKKYVKEEDYEALNGELKQYFHGNITDLNTALEQVSPGLIEYLQQGRVVITNDDFTWQESIRFAGKGLVEAGSIERAYLDTIISQIQYYGPYMFISKGLVLAHAKPEDGVHHLDVSLTIFKNPVQFSDFFEAKLIITLATEDQERHLKILKDIMYAFADGNSYRVDDMAELEQEEAVIRYLKMSIAEGAD